MSVDIEERSVVAECLGEVDRVEITKGKLTDEKTPFDELPWQFMVTLIEIGPDGGELGLWYGATHAEAMRQAKNIPASLGLDYPIVDRTNGDTRHDL